MRSLLLGLGIMAAAALALLAVVVGPGHGPGVALGVGAIVAACLVLLLAVVPADALRRVRRQPGPVRVTAVAEWLQSGELGHEEIVRLLDTVDRMGAHATLPVRTEPEMETFRLMSRAEFLAVVARRLDEIEGPL